ncbi:MAG: epoxyqueuosine reductase [Clostridiales bacterium]|nr:epoxyqueuosine reductase [Clostridiales bacterium]
MNSNEFTEKLRLVALNSGAELFGVLSAQKIDESAPDGHKSSDLLANVKSIIVLACGRKLNEDRDYVYKWGPDYTLTYIKLKAAVKKQRQEARRSIEAVKGILRSKGFKAVTEPHGWTGLISFKQASYLSGLGVFGKGSFVVNPDLGHVNILGCILTDANLTYDIPLSLDVCGDCMECIKACKYGAFTKIEGKYEWIAEKCRCYDLIMNPVTLKWTYGPCNSKCVNVCPVGK